MADTLQRTILATLGALFLVGSADFVLAQRATHRLLSPNSAQATNPYSHRTEHEVRRSFSYGSTRYQPAEYNVRRSGGTATRNSAGVGIRGTSGGAVTNSPGLGVPQNGGIGVRNNPGIAVRNQPGIAVRNSPGIAVRNTPSADFYTAADPSWLRSPPDRSRRIRHHGRTYYMANYRYYRPVYRPGGVYYASCYPPVGYVVDTLPDYARTVVVDNTTYHTFNNAYYVNTQQNGQSAYQVVPPPQNTSGQTSPQAPANAPTTAPAADQSDPFDIARQMSDFLADQKGFTLVAKDTYETRDEEGEPVRRTNRRTFNLSRPHKLIVDIDGDDGNIRAYYDGHSLSIHHRDANAYSVLTMPSTIDAMLIELAEKYALTLPLADLLYDDVYDAVIGQATHGQIVGTDRIGRYPTHRLLFWNDEIDWELWIDQGDEPLPRKLVITYKTEPGTPRYSAVIRKWQLSPTYPSEHFRFRVPEGAEKVDISPVRASTETKEIPSTDRTEVTEREEDRESD